VIYPLDHVVAPGSVVLYDNVRRRVSSVACVLSEPCQQVTAARADLMSESIAWPSVFVVWQHMPLACVVI
jgi:hypothetical protein